MDSSEGGRVTSTMLSRRPRPLSGLVAATAILSCLLVSVACWHPERNLYLQLAAIPSRVLQEGEFYRLVTALAVHADLRHFLSNALLLGIFAYLLYGYFGFWVFPAGALLLGATVNYLSLLTYPPEIRLVGASGMIYGMAGFWLMMYMLVERRLSFGRRTLHGVGVGLVLLVPPALDQSVSYRSHGIGLGLGVVFALAYFACHRERIRSEEVRELEPEMGDGGAE
jgi:rhomboid protease GluP